MSAEIASFVDTNILVYAFERAESRKKRISGRLLADLMDAGLLRLSTQVLQELFVTLTRKVARRSSDEEALAVLEDLTAWPAAIVDWPMIRRAARLAGGAGLSLLGRA